METVILKSILESFHSELNFSDKQLLQVSDYLFKETSPVLISNSSEINETLEYLKDLVIDYSLHNSNELLKYLKQSRTNYAKFLWEVIDLNNSMSEMNEEKIAYHKDLYFPIQGYFTYNIYSHSEISSSTFQKSFKDCLNHLSIQFKQIISRSIRHKFAHLKEFKINLAYTPNNHFVIANTRYLSVKRKLFRYFEEFSNIENSKELAVWKSVKKDDSINSSILFLQRECSGSESPYSSEAKIKLEQEVFSKIYDNILLIIQREKQIADKNIKEEIINWLLYSKFYCSEIPFQEQRVKDYKVPLTDFKIKCNNDTYLPIHYKRNIIKTKTIYQSILGLKKWTILKSPPGHTWLTSDNPGFGINLADLCSNPSSFSADASFENIRTDTLIYYPLSSKYCLRMQPEILDKKDNIEDSMIEFEHSTFLELEFVNGLTVSTRGEVIIAKDKKMLEQLELI